MIRIVTGVGRPRIFVSSVECQFTLAWDICICRMVSWTQAINWRKTLSWTRQVFFDCFTSLCVCNVLLHGRNTWILFFFLFLALLVLTIGTDWIHSLLFNYWNPFRLCPQVIHNITLMNWSWFLAWNGPFPNIPFLARVIHCPFHIIAYICWIQDIYFESDGLIVVLLMLVCLLICSGTGALAIFLRRLFNLDITTSDYNDQEIEDNIAHNCRVNGITPVLPHIKRMSSFSGPSCPSVSSLLSILFYFCFWSRVSFTA